MNNTNTTTKEKQIAAAVISHVQNGMTIMDAVRLVCGAKKVDAMIDGLYEALRAK